MSRLNPALAVAALIALAASPAPAFAQDQPPGGGAAAKAAAEKDPPPPAPAAPTYDYPKIPAYFCSDDDRHRFITALDKVIDRAQSQANDWATYLRKLREYLGGHRDNPVGYRQAAAALLDAEIRAQRTQDFLAALKAERAVAAKMQHIDCRRPHPQLPQPPHEGWTGGAGHLPELWGNPPPAFVQKTPQVPEKFCSEKAKAEMVAALDADVKSAQLRVRDWKAYLDILEGQVEAHKGDPAQAADLATVIGRAKSSLAKAETAETELTALRDQTRKAPVVDCNTPKAETVAPPPETDGLPPPKTVKSVQGYFESLAPAPMVPAPVTAPIALPSPLEQSVQVVWSATERPRTPIRPEVIEADLTLPDCYATPLDRDERILMLELDLESLGADVDAVGNRPDRAVAAASSDFGLALQIIEAIYETEDTGPCPPGVLIGRTLPVARVVVTPASTAELLRSLGLDANGVLLRDNRPRREDEPSSVQGPAAQPPGWRP